MTVSKHDNPLLLLIDIQKGFCDLDDWGGQRNNPSAEENAGKLLAFWRRLQLPVIHIKHCSDNPNSKLAEGNIGNEFQDMVMPLEREPVIKKNVNSAFIGTDLKQQPDDREIRNVVIVGLTTDHCVSTTTRMAGNYGYNTFIVADATATFNKKGFDGQEYPADLIHNTALASLDKEFATVVTTNELITAMNRD